MCKSDNIRTDKAWQPPHNCSYRNTVRTFHLFNITVLGLKGLTRTTSQLQLLEYCCYHAAAASLVPFTSPPPATRPLLPDVHKTGFSMQLSAASARLLNFQLTAAAASIANTSAGGR